MKEKLKESSKLKNDQSGDDILEVIKRFIEFFDEVDREEKSDYSCKHC